VTGLPISASIFAVSFAYTSFFEYALHRWLMHGLRSFVREDHVVHHREHFLRRETDPHHVLFAWWVAPAILFGHFWIFWSIDALTGLSVTCPCLSAFGVYYVLYEYIHWCIHNPADRLIERTFVFRYLRRNHHLHHLQPRANFNVLLPLGDLFFGTLQRPICIPARGNGVIPPSRVRN
jgi:hypothetical protein